jgi:hypothetical protein
VVLPEVRRAGQTLLPELGCVVGEGLRMRQREVVIGLVSGGEERQQVVKELAGNLDVRNVPDAGDHHTGGVRDIVSGRFG